MHTPKRAAKRAPLVVRIPAEDKKLYKLAADAATDGNLSKWIKLACAEKLQRQLAGQ